MGAITGTEVTAARQNYGNLKKKLFTATTAGVGDTITLAAYFENVYYVKAWKLSDGTDAEAFVTTKDTYLPAITITQNKGAIYVEAIGTDVKSTGGST